MKLKAVGLFVDDLAKMVAFYRDVAGFASKWDGKDPSVIVEQDGLRSSYVADPEGNLIEIAAWDSSLL